MCIRDRSGAGQRRREVGQDLLGRPVCLPDPDGEPMSTSPAATALDTALAGLAARMKRPALLVALDFDGTLTPLRDDPDRSRILRSGVAALRTLATRSGVEIALVSGRALVDLYLRADVPVGTHLVGSHGAERGIATADGVTSVAVTLDAAQQALLDTVGACLLYTSDAADDLLCV